MPFFWPCQEDDSGTREWIRTEFMVSGLLRSPNIVCRITSVCCTSHEYALASKTN